ncbi:MAG: iron uptake porin [Crocosphaera sp.]
MSYFLKKIILIGLILFGSLLLTYQKILADETSEEITIIEYLSKENRKINKKQKSIMILNFNSSSNSRERVTNVSELKNILQTDWAYELLDSIVERYDCIVGNVRDPALINLSNNSFSRWEFAEQLNTCLITIKKLLKEGFILEKEDLINIKKLTKEFKKELAYLDANINILESKFSHLEEHQFLTTTKLKGELITTFSGVWGNETASLKSPPNTPISDGQIAVNYRYRLILDTSFHGEDLLRIRLQTANFKFARAGSNLTDYNFSANTNNYLKVNKVFYRFPVGKQAKVWIASTRLNLDDISDPLAPFTGGTTEGAISFFGAISPIYLLNDNSGVGIGAIYNLTDNLNLSAYYAAGNGNDVSRGKGLFNGQFGVGTQLTYFPTPSQGIAIAYVHDYIPQGQVSNFSVLGFTGLANTDTPFGENATSSDNIALLGNWRITPGFSIEGWGMYTNTYANGGEYRGQQADIWNWKISLAFPDLFAEGNLGVITVGIPPYAASITNINNVADQINSTDGNPLLLEAFYVLKMPNSPNISITPGIFLASNPANDRDPLWVVTIRSSFKF